eukprot:s550_g9.t1
MESVLSVCISSKKFAKPALRRDGVTMRWCWTLAWCSIVQVMVSGSAAWEPIDEEMDIMAFIDDEPEGISFIQKDARLAAGCGADCPEAVFSAFVAPLPPEPSGFSFEPDVARAIKIKCGKILQK